MSRYPGVVIAIVKELEDPRGEGRIRVQFPWLQQGQEEQDSAWAPIATLMAGGDRGSYFMPEIDDEVLVSFEHGMFDHPFVIGFLWNGVDLPPHSDINPSVRRLRTVSGHTIDFDDNSGSEKIIITTAGGHEMEMEDGVSGGVTITTSGGHEINMNDTPPASITISSSGGQSVTLNDVPGSISLTTMAGSEISVKDGPQGITLSAPTASLSIQCMQASVTASSILNITAPMTTFSGVVQAQTVIATSVVSSSYTPGAGNLFGL